MSRVAGRVSGREQTGLFHSPHNDRNGGDRVQGLESGHRASVLLFSFDFFLVLVGSRPLFKLFSFFFVPPPIMAVVKLNSTYHDEISNSIALFFDS